MKTPLKAHLMLIAAATIGGFNYTISKMVMPEFAKPLSIVVLRGIVALIVFNIIHYFFVKEKVEIKDIGKLILAALFGIGINQTTFYEGLNLTSPINASLMMTGTPIVVLIISTLAAKEKLTSLKIAGVILGTIGSVLLLLKSGRTSLNGFFIGDILILINAVSWALFLVVAKPLMFKYNPFTILKWTFLFGFIMILPFGFQDFTSTSWELFSAEAIWALLFVLVFATLGAYFLNFAVLKYVNPSVSGSYIYLQPFLAAIVAIAWGVDMFSFEKLIYLLMILLGVYMVNRKSI